LSSVTRELILADDISVHFGDDLIDDGWRGCVGGVKTQGAKAK